MRITADTAILVRMNVKASGSARRLLDVILDGPHDLILSEFLLKETARVLRYPRMQGLYKLTEDDIFEHVELLRARSDLVGPVVHTPVVLADQNDDPWSIRLSQAEPRSFAPWTEISIPIKSSAFAEKGA